MDGAGADPSLQDALLLPALSSIATRQEMEPLAARLSGRLRCITADWPGFGAPVPGRQRLSAGVLNQWLDREVPRLIRAPAVGIAAGHGALMLAAYAQRHPEMFRQLVLIAPTWRGPIPTMTGGRRPALASRVRAALEMPIVGPLLFRINLSRPVVGWMMREHVYARGANVSPAVLDAKMAVARRDGARLGTAAFVSGGLDPAPSREDALRLLHNLPPTLLIRPQGAPRRSAAEMDAMGGVETIQSAVVDGALAPHEEHPDAVADAILAFLTRSAAAADGRRAAFPIVPGHLT